MKSEQNLETPQADALTDTMDRRTMFMRTGAFAALGGLTAMSGTAHAAENDDKSWNVNADLISTALHCVQESERCIAHCVSSFREGSLMLAKCSGLTLETIATCNALAKLAAYGSPNLKDMAKVCLAACAACEAECALHAGHHEQCKRCAESCRACIAACEKVVG